MPIYRDHKNNNITTISNEIFNDNRLSWKAKGLLCQMLSLPEDFNLTVENLQTLTSDGNSATRSALVELEKHGYLTRKAIRDRGKIVDLEYSIYENPRGAHGTFV